MHCSEQCNYDPVRTSTVSTLCWLRRLNLARSSIIFSALGVEYPYGL